MTLTHVVTVRDTVTLRRDLSATGYVGAVHPDGVTVRVSWEGAGTSTLENIADLFYILPADHVGERHTVDLRPGIPTVCGEHIVEYSEEYGDDEYVGTCAHPAGHDGDHAVESVEITRQYSDGTKYVETFTRSATGEYTTAAGEIVDATDADTLRAAVESIDAHYGADVETDPRCVACGEPIDYCQGHGEIGDPVGAAILDAHDDGDHNNCHPLGCDETPVPAVGASVFVTDPAAPGFHGTITAVDEISRTVTVSTWTRDGEPINYGVAVRDVVEITK
ncbi:hypothetical protein SEA_NOSILAM_83 [Gordonia phage NosilaM]|uniref:Uncharacterized protein n=1 Tax=Gordonia phage NosilaM TaxID=2507863 RepID=A0A410TE75_9CAUD|nr:hypothetical protein KNU46_gp83 [Gordonia phage NosilaM]QAU07324.1 hypothetical protein SEA_NOSILAM_83 [Gordonia phage NosilaM]